MERQESPKYMLRFSDLIPLKGVKNYLERSLPAKKEDIDGVAYRAGGLLMYNALIITLALVEVIHRGLEALAK